MDDSNIISDIVEPGIRYVDNQLIKIEEKVEEDKKVPEDQRTAILLRKIANSVCNFLEVEVDCPTMHQTKRLPILDLEVEMVNNKVEYRYYRKEMANFKVNMTDSAMPYKMKKICLIQEVVRI